jgi:hypothetical protein
LINAYFFFIFDLLPADRLLVFCHVRQTINSQ